MRKREATVWTEIEVVLPLFCEYTTTMLGWFQMSVTSVPTFEWSRAERAGAPMCACTRAGDHPRAIPPIERPGTMLQLAWRAARAPGPAVRPSRQQARSARRIGDRLVEWDR